MAINKSAASPLKGSGFGQMSLLQVSEKYGLDLEKSISILEKKGIKVDKDSKMKKLADELKTTPFELFELIK